MFSGSKSSKSHRMLFVLRFGLLLIALMAVHVLITVHQQLLEVNQVFGEIVRSRTTAYNDESNARLSSSTTDNIEYNPGYITNTKRNNDDLVDPKLNPSIRDQVDLSKLRPQHEKYIRRFRTQFQEDVYTLERQTFESNRKLTEAPMTFPDSTNDKARLPETKTLRNEVDDLKSSSFKQRTKPRAKVMILAYRRSGSSFLGEMLNRNPKVFYLFEPVYPIEDIAGSGKYPLLYDTLQRHLLEVIYTCSFTKHPFLVHFISSSPFRLKSQILRSFDLCPRNITSREINTCRSINASQLSWLCRSSSYIAVKTIRTSARKIHEFLERSDLEEAEPMNALKVIHLVRDPRAIISSRLVTSLRNMSELLWLNRTNRQHSMEDKLAHVLIRSTRVASANLCSRMYSDIKHGQQGLKAYRMIRYEDAAKRPFEAYEKVYKFVGIDKSLEVEEWLTRNTKEDKDSNYYSTSRNSSASINRWRLRLPMYLVMVVQEQCRHLMDIVGYVVVQNEDQLKDMSKPLFIPSTNGVLWKSPMSKQVPF